MSDYTIEISGNQPYYVEVDNSSLQEIVNLTISKDNDVNIGVSTSNTFLTFETPSGYPIGATSGDLSYLRVSGLIDYVDQVASGLTFYVNQVAADHIQSYHVFPVSPPPIDGGTP
jgi:hypothetical protein